MVAVMKPLCYQKDASGKNTWKYTPSVSTDVRKTFARARKRMAEDAAKIPKNVRTMKVAK